MAKEIVGVVGAGTMGAGIAQVALEAGHEVLLNDVDEAAIERGRARIRDGLGRRAAKLDLDADTIDDWIEGRSAGLRDAHSLDALGAEADLVIEAALEDLDLKQTIFRTLDAAVGERDGVVLATNTSALSVGRIAAVAHRPERVVGLHFFNPAPLMALVEVVSHELSDEAVVGRAASLVESWGKTAVRSADAPGFIVNRVNRPFTLEALAMLDAGDAGIEAIDEAIRGAGFPMGPFELMDLIGVDVNLAVARAIWEGFDRADRFRPSPTQERLVDDGHLGRKTGAGFYEYATGQRGAAIVSGGDGRLGADRIVERVVLAIVAEAFRAANDGVATPEDIDSALRLGAAHPIGPFERVAELGGPPAIVERLNALRPAGTRFEPPAGLLAAAERD